MDRAVISPNLREAGQSGEVCRGRCSLGRDLKHAEALARGSPKRKHVQSLGTQKTCREWGACGWSQGTWRETRRRWLEKLAGVRSCKAWAATPRTLDFIPKARAPSRVGTGPDLCFRKRTLLCTEHTAGRRGWNKQGCEGSVHGRITGDPAFGFLSRVSLVGSPLLAGETWGQESK